MSSARYSPHVGDCGLGTLAHDVAEHAGEDEPLLAAGHHRDLDEEDVTPRRVQARPVATPGRSVRSATSSKKRGRPRVLHQVVGDHDGIAPPLGQSARHLPGHRG